jgi:hypothetical protein
MKSSVCGPAKSLEVSKSIPPSLLSSKENKIKCVPSRINENKYLNSERNKKIMFVVNIL